MGPRKGALNPRKRSFSALGRGCCGTAVKVCCRCIELFPGVRLWFVLSVNPLLSFLRMKKFMLLWLLMTLTLSVVVAAAAIALAVAVGVAVAVVLVLVLVPLLVVVVAAAVRAWGVGVARVRDKPPAIADRSVRACPFKLPPLGQERFCKPDGRIKFATLKKTYRTERASIAHSMETTWGTALQNPYSIWNSDMENTGTLAILCSLGLPLWKTQPTRPATANPSAAFPTPARPR